MIYKSKNEILNANYKFLNQAPYSNLLCEFVSDISKKLLALKNIKNYPDLFEFAFWCRNSNILRKKKKFKDIYKNRKPLGIVFHVPPSNIPTNFAYSLVFGLLTGNTNVIRLSKNTEPHSKILLRIISELVKSKYKILKKSNYFLYYDRDEDINKKLSKIADARMIWGSNKTINIFKEYPTKPYCRDFNFFERFSICVLNSDTVNKINNKDLLNLVHNFYNDTYLTNQAACSSPRIIFWVGKKKLEAKKKFWYSLYKYLSNRDDFLTEFISIDKELFANINYAKIKSFIKNYENFKNLINIINLKKIPKNIDQLKGNNGFFYQFDLKNINEIKKNINRNYQTLTYFGITKEQIKKCVISKNMNGIDRVVPVGQSLNIDFNWDGLDLNNSLTREVVIV